MSKHGLKVEPWPYWTPVLTWLLTGFWVAALVWTWVNYERWPLWAKICIALALVVTTPVGEDLFMVVRVARSVKKRGRDANSDAS